MAKRRSKNAQDEAPPRPESGESLNTPAGPQPAGETRMDVPPGEQPEQPGQQPARPEHGYGEREAGSGQVLPDEQRGAGDSPGGERGGQEPPVEHADAPDVDKGRGAVEGDPGERAGEQFEPGSGYNELYGGGDWGERGLAEYQHGEYPAGGPTREGWDPANEPRPEPADPEKDPDSEPEEE